MYVVGRRAEADSSLPSFRPPSTTGPQSFQPLMRGAQRADCGWTFQQQRAGSSVARAGEDPVGDELLVHRLSGIRAVAGAPRG